MDENMSKAPKIMGALSIKTDTLKKDVGDASKLIKQLSGDAEKLGEVFKDLSKNTSVSGVANDLGKSVSDNGKKAKEAVTKVNKEIEELNQKTIEAISHNLKIGTISYQQAYDQSHKYLDKIMADLAHINKYDTVWQKGLVKQGKGNDFVPTDVSEYSRERVKAESFIEDIRRQMEKTEQAFEKSQLDKAKKATQAIEDENKEKQQQQENLIKQLMEKAKADTAQRIALEKDRIKSELALAKARYRQGEIDHKEYFKSLRKIENDALLNGSFTQQEMTGIGNEKSGIGVNYRKEKLAQEKLASQEAWKQAKVLKVTQYKEDLQGYLVHLKQMLTNDKTYAREKQLIQKEIASVEAKLNSQTLADEKKIAREAMDANKVALKELQAQAKMDIKNRSLGGTQQRFDSLTNYIFDAGLLYGTITGLKQISTEINNIEKEATNLARVIPDSNKFISDRYVQQSFQLASDTAQQVGDVQKIQVLWAKTSDSIAKNASAMKELTEVSATSLNVGGFDSVEQSVQLLNGAINQMNLQWTDARAVMDSWVKVADTSAVGSAKDLAEATMAVGTQAKMLGMSYNDINAITGILANNMSKTGDDIGTAMKTVFSYLTDDKAIDTLHKYGVEVKKNGKEYNNFITIMENLMVKYKELNMDNNQQGMREINDALGRTRRVDYVGTLIDNWGEYKDLVQTSLGASGYAEEQNAKVMDTLEAKVNQLKVSFSQLAWGIGETGLLGDFKALVDSGGNIIRWINDLDPLTKNIVVRFSEIGVALVLLSKTTNLLTGVGLVKFFANTTAELAYMTKSQVAFNLAKKAGADIEVIETVAKNANTASQVANNVAEEVGVGLSGEATAMEGAETVATTANTSATVANTEAQITLNNTKMASTIATGSLMGALKSLVNPVSLLITGVTLLGMAFYAHSQKIKLAKEETDKFKMAQDDLNKSLKSDVVQETEVGSYKEKLDNLKALRYEYEDLKKAQENAQKALTDATSNSNLSDMYNAEAPDANFNASTEGAQKAYKALQEANKALDAVNKKMREAGVTSETLGSTVDRLTSIVDKSSIAENRKAMTVLNSIRGYMDANNAIRDSITEYETMASSITNSEQVTDRFRQLTAKLIAMFPQYAGSVNRITGLTEVNTQAIWGEIGAKNSLTKVQTAELAQSAMLDEASKQVAVAYVKNQISMTEASLEGSQERINILQQEMNALAIAIDAQSEFDSPESLAMQKLYTRSKNEIKRIQGVFADLSGLKSILTTVSNIKPFSVGDVPNTPLAGDDKKSDAQNKYNQQYADNYKFLQDLQSQLVSALKKSYEKDRDNAIKELDRKEKEEIAYHDKKIKMYQDELNAMDELDKKDKRDGLTKLEEERARWAKQQNDPFAKQKVIELDKQIADTKKDIKRTELQDAIAVEEAKKTEIGTSYEDQRQKVKDDYDLMLEDKNIYETANKLITSNSQQAILDLLTTYAPKYSDLGALFGKNLTEALNVEMQNAIKAYDWLKTATPPTDSSTPPLVETPVNNPSAPNGGSGSVIAWDGKYYKYGSRGDGVKRIQKNLGITADGIWGKNTDSAVRNFQRNNGLSADGIVGKNTWEKLIKFKNGGLVDFTGMAWVDGSKSKPEYMLNNVQTEAFLRLTEVLPKMDFAGLDRNAITINSPLIHNEIQIVNNTPTDVDNQINSLNDFLKDEMRSVGQKIRR